jgi:hypothetical protein
VVTVTAVRGINRGRSEVVVLVREVVRATAVHLANCGGGYGRARTRPTKGAKKQRAKPPVSLFLPREMRAALIGRS